MHNYIKASILFFSLCFSCFISYAQFQFGIKAGYNLANLQISNHQFLTQKSISTFNGGITAAKSLAKNLILLGELIYSVQGSDIILQEGNGNAYFHRRLYYLNLPVVLKYQFEPAFFLETGPLLGYLMSANSEYHGQFFNDKGYQQPFDFSWVFGGGYQIPKLNLGLDIRYNLGINNIQRQPIPYADVISVTKNKVFQVALFYYFKLGSK